MNQTPENTAGKKPHLELMRVIAIFMVLFYHTNGCYSLLETADVYSVRYWAGITVILIVSACIFPFFMISGALLLGKNESISKLLKKRVLKMLLILGLISLFYYFIYGKNSTGLHPLYFLQLTYSSNMSFHLWYLYAYIGFLLMLPLLRPMVQNMENRHFIYFLCLYFVFRLLLPVGETVFFKEQYSINSELLLPFVFTDCIAFPILGYFIENRIDRKYFSVKHTVAVLGGCAGIMVLCVLMTGLRVRILGAGAETDPTVYRFGFYATLCMGLHFGLKSFFIRRQGGEHKIICFMGGCSFGIYLFESVLREINFGVYERLLHYMPEFPAALLWTTCAYAAGLLLVGALKLIPGVKKLI